jgi:alpha-galactosidase
MNIQLNGLSLPSNAPDFRPTKGGVIANSIFLTLNLPTQPKRYLYSGWQSWSLTAWVDTDRPIRPMRPKNQQSRVADPLYVNDPRPNGSWYGAVEWLDEQVIFLGAIGLNAHVALEGNTLMGWGENGSVEWFLGYGNEADIFSRYAELLGERFGIGHGKTSPRVWCSWYSLYTEIQEQVLLKILADLGPHGSDQGLPFEVFQVDDGWQRGIGDWEANEKFPSGMEWLAARIKTSGRTAGLWLAPLLMVPSASVCREHPDWLLHDGQGALVSAGFNWSEPLVALDTTHPAALEWLAALMTKVRAWGYDYVKLDFLYAGALPGKRHMDIPRELAYRNGLKTMRAALGEAYLLTCGAPMLPSLGLCDGLRVGPDVAGTWASRRDDQLLMNFAIPGVRNALRTTLNRVWLQPLVNTDPDVVYFCGRQNNLTPEQKSLLQDLAQICNFKASSDIPAWLTDSEWSDLCEFLEHKPEVRKTGRTTYQLDCREVDFGAHIGMPPLPYAFTNLQGAVIGGLANITALIRIFEIMGRYSLRKMLKHNPV